MNFNLINNSNIDLLKTFIKNEISNSFRYYHSRSLDVIKNHIITLILTDENKNIIGYGHLDYEGKIWLGICVCEKFRGLGYGKKIMNYLLEYAENNNMKKIYLTVDKDNIIAKKMYEKYGFIIKNENKNLFKMVKKL